jgi:hypothetical protein
MSMQLALPSTPQDPVEMQEMQPLASNVSYEPQEGIEEDEMAPLLGKPLIPYQVSDGDKDLALLQKRG